MCVTLANCTHSKLVPITQRCSIFSPVFWLFGILIQDKNHLMHHLLLCYVLLTALSVAHATEVLALQQYCRGSLLLLLMGLMHPLEKSCNRCMMTYTIKDETSSADFTILEFNYFTVCSSSLPNLPSRICCCQEACISIYISKTWSWTKHHQQFPFPF